MGAVLSSPVMSYNKRDYNLDDLHLSDFSSRDNFSGSKSSISMRGSALSLFSRSGIKSSFLNSFSLMRLNISSSTKEKSSTPVSLQLTDKGKPREISYKWWDIDLEDNFEINNNSRHFPKVCSSFSNLRCNSLKKCTSCQTLRFETKTVPPYSDSVFLDNRCISQRSEQSFENINNNNLFHQPVVHSTLKTITHANNTGELLKCMGYFLFYHCPQLNIFQPGLAVSWVRSIDRALILQGWAEIAFVTPPNVVFLFMLLRDIVETSDISSEDELRALLQTCLYLAYTYVGNEISYPLKPFIIGDDRSFFWERCLYVVNRKSSDMLRINGDPLFFAEMFTELQSYKKYIK